MNLAAQRWLMPSEEFSAPEVLIINDDRSLLQSRRQLLENCGATVSTARGTAEAIVETILDPADLILIDATNVGPEHGAFLCGIVKKLRPSKPVALLAFSDTEIPPTTPADRVIYRNDPRQLLIEINEMLDGRLKLDA
jgi:response regulator RpfG family c-di-GMP phosphodiesterase